MSEGSKIQWCDDTWNPWRGCRRVDSGCVNCYIVRTVPFRMTGQVHGAVRVRASEAVRFAPLKWNKKPWVCDECGKCFADEDQAAGCSITHGNQQDGLSHRRRVFSLSLGDWLDDEVPIEWLCDMLDVIRKCPDLIFMLLSKRLEHFEDRLMLAWNWAHHANNNRHNLRDWIGAWQEREVPQNIRIGGSISDQKSADKRITELLKIRAAGWFISCEPMLERIDLKLTRPQPLHDPEYGDQHEYYEVNRGIHQVIFGGESGPGARPCNIDWIKDGMRQCQEAGVKVFVKQLGSDPRHNTTGEAVFTGPIIGKTEVKIVNSPLRLKDKKGGDVAEWPEDLRVREVPE